MTSPLHQRIRRTIQRHAMCPLETSVLIGLSGGSDSVALTLLLLDLSKHGGFRVVSLAHLNHRLRGSAERDEGFCRRLAERLQLPIVIEAIDVRDYAASQRLSLEDAARRLRYGFLERASAQAGADRIAVGHTRDDQVETFFLKLMRGAGLTGLGGVYPRRGAVIRPLLDVSRDELRTFLASRGETWVEDESNADLDNPRNRIRHRVLPELDLAYGGTTRPAIARAADLIREDAQWLDELSQRRLEALAVRRPDGLEIDATALSNEPSPVLRRILLAAMRTAAAHREVELNHVEAAMAVLRGSSAGADVPGSRWELRGGKLVLIQQGEWAK